ncbi:MAG: DUF2269 domain-containing protein [Pseudonocardiaceae bacterium]|nr:DUF2269 domain-containing protein [Pseudonocardiaceae bacterium]
MTTTTPPGTRTALLPRRARSVLLAVHVTMSVGWIGLDLSLLVLAVAALRTGDAPAAAAMGLLGRALLAPFAFGSLVTGLALSLTTPWGLLRYWWVLAKFVITSALVAAGLIVLLPRLQLIAAGAQGPIRIQAVVATSVALALLVTATVLSVVKPWGRTARGRRAAAAARPGTGAVHRLAGSSPTAR